LRPEERKRESERPLKEKKKGCLQSELQNCPRKQERRKGRVTDELDGGTPDLPEKSRD